MKDESARDMGYDVHSIFQRMRENEAKHPERMAKIPLPYENRTGSGETAQ